MATFDQDGNLWTEHPLYAQAMFALDRLGKLAPQHSEWKQYSRSPRDCGSPRGDGEVH